MTLLAVSMALQGKASFHRRYRDWMFYSSEVYVHEGHSLGAINEGFSWAGAS